MKDGLRVCGVICMIIVLCLTVSLTAKAKCGYETNKFNLKAGVEGGGWTAAWADDISETDVAQGVVAAGVSIYAANPAPFYAWVEELIRMTIQSLSSSIQDRFSQRVIEQANQLAAEAIKAAIQGQRANEVLRQFDTVDFKAGAIQYAGRNYCKGLGQDVTLSNTWGIKPYVAFRWRGSDTGGGEVIVASPDWESAPASGMADIAIGSDGKIWVIGIDGTVWFTPDGSNWSRTNASGMANIAVGPDGKIWVVGHDGTVWVSSDGSNWNNTNSSNFRRISVGLNGAVWGVEKDSTVWKRR